MIHNSQSAQEVLQANSNKIHNNQSAEEILLVNSNKIHNSQSAEEVLLVNSSKIHNSPSAEELLQANSRKIHNSQSVEEVLQVNSRKIHNSQSAEEVLQVNSIVFTTITNWWDDLCRREKPSWNYGRSMLYNGQASIQMEDKVLWEEEGRAMESLETSSQCILRNWYDTENRTPQMHYVNNAFKAWAISTTNASVATVVSSI